MGKPRRHHIIIVGGGPAGIAAALHIAKRSPELTHDLIVIEAQQYPRPKICGGGITVHGEEQLKKLGVHLDVPAFNVNSIEFRIGTHAFVVKHAQAMRIIQRDEFDAAFADAAVQAGICVQTGERVTDIIPQDDGVEVITDRDHYHATVLIAADGARSIVRQKLRLHNTPAVARLLRLMTPVEPEETRIWQSKTAVFDFSCVRSGIEGYSWAFPCYINGKPYLNRGIMDSRLLANSHNGKRSLKGTFAAELSLDNVNLEDNNHLEGHPVRWFDPNATFALPHVLLTGDAAGVDPMFAEGISYAMEYGEVVAEAVAQADATGDYSFGSYRDQLLAHRLGILLMRRTAVARHLYRQQFPWAWSLLFELAGYSPRLVQRKIGASLALLPS